jgi:integrase/recombinase XerD
MDQRHFPSHRAERLYDDAPFVDERDRYRLHCAEGGARPAVLRVKRNELLWIARFLGPHASQGVSMETLLRIAHERQNLHGAVTAARRVVDIGRPWLRFLGWWREPTAAFRHQTQLDRYLAWMRNERGFTPSSVEQLAALPAGSCIGASRRAANSAISKPEISTTTSRVRGRGVGPVSR